MNKFNVHWAVVNPNWHPERVIDRGTTAIEAENQGDAVRVWRAGVQMPPEREAYVEFVTKRSEVNSPVL